MSHVADGILHAYLDGALDALSDAGELPDGMQAADVQAHIAACADCRARLEAERSVRESSGAILGDASLPHVDVPAFAGVAGPRRARRARWLPLGWAASVLLALGAGWWGSEAWRADRSAGVTLDQETVQTSARQSPLPRPERASTAAPPAQRAELEADAVGRPRQASAGSADEQPSPSGSTDQTGIRAADAPAIAASGPPPAEAAGDVSAGAEPREPIGVALGHPPAARESAPNTTALQQIVRAQDVTTASPIAEARRSFAAAPPPAAGTVDSAMPDAQKARLSVDVREAAAFDSAIARERSGRLHFRSVTPSNQHMIEDQLFIVADASAPVVEAASEPGRTTVRVRQTLSSGQRVEIVTWREHAVVLSELVVTGTQAGRRDVPARSSAAAAQPEAPARQDSPARQDAAAAESLNVISSSARRLEDGRRELVLRSSADGTVWIAIRAAMSDGDLRTLAVRLARP